MEKKNSSMKWDANIPPGDLLKDTILILCLSGIFVCILLELIFRFDGQSFILSIAQSIAKSDPYFFYAAGFIAFWLLLGFVFCWAIYGRGYEATFCFDNRRVWMNTRPRMKKINTFINTALFFLSLFSGKPGGMGTALLAQSGQSSGFYWRDIHKMVAYPKRSIIVLKNSWRTVFRLYCTPENYQSVLGLVQYYIDFYKPTRENKN